MPTFEVRHLVRDHARELGLGREPLERRARHHDPSAEGGVRAVTITAQDARRPREHRARSEPIRDPLENRERGDRTPRRARDEHLADPVRSAGRRDRRSGFGRPLAPREQPEPECEADDVTKKGPESHADG